MNISCQNRRKNNRITNTGTDTLNISLFSTTSLILLLNVVFSIGVSAEEKRKSVDSDPWWHIYNGK